MNRFHDQLQNTIGIFGDRIAKYHQMTKALAEIRELPDAALKDESRLQKVEFIIQRCAQVVGEPIDELRRPNAPFGDTDNEL